MKKLILSLLLFPVLLFAQQSQTTLKQIKGTVIDSTKQTVIGATVKLVSKTDTVMAATNAEGTFSFRNIKSSSFTITISSLGYAALNRAFSFPTTQADVTLPLLTLETQNNMLNEVIVDGTPTITYKTDTTEYKVSDYQVRENATVEDLLKKMEGMEVDKDGKVTVKGENVVRARINGKNYFGGDVANAIKDLPADIAEKIQIIDDYGDEAEKTGIKDGDPQKVLNIVTRADKRVGQRGRFDSGVGSDDRYRANFNGNRFDGNQQLAIQTGLNNTVTGIAGDNGGGGSGGIRQTVRAGFNFNDDLSKKIKLNTSYSFQNNNSESENSSFITNFYDKGTIYSDRSSTNENKSNNHNFEAKLEYQIDSATWLTFSPNLQFQKSINFNNSTVNQTGLQQQEQFSKNANTNKSPNLGFNLNLGHRFNKKGTFISLYVRANRSNNEQDRDNDSQILSYDTLNNTLIKDSLFRRLVNVDNLSKNYRSSLTFSHPISEKSRVELNAQLNYRGYDNQQITNGLDPQQNLSYIDSLSNIFNYSFTESRFTVNYRVRQEKFKYSIGISAVPSVLKGESFTRNNTTSRNSFNIVPVARFEYSWSKQKRLNFRYNGRPQEPNYNQIQDVPDVSNPQNVVYGNPNLKTSFRHSVDADFNNYITDSKVSMRFGLDADFMQNQVVRNVILRDDDDLGGFRRETTYINVSKGNYNYSANYNLSKRFGDGEYSISIDGATGFEKSVSFNNGEQNFAERWSTHARGNVQINPKEWLEIVPNVRYSYNQTNFTLAQSIDTYNSNWALSLEGKTYFIPTLYWSYDLSKNFVNGINSNVTSNPFIINTGLTKEFFKRRNGSVSLRAYDLLNQNNFVTRQTDENSIVDTKSNALSRYLMLSLSWTPQSWGGKSIGGDRGRGRGNWSGGGRRGDGSYM